MEHPEPSERSAILEQSLMDTAVESWRFARLFWRLVSRLEPGENTRYINQLRYFYKRLEENLERAGIRLVSLEGQPYDTGVAATALNVADFSPDDVLVVDQMLEPIIMGTEGLLRPGTVTLRKELSDENLCRD
jgi:hypothetical protein